MQSINQLYTFEPIGEYYLSKIPEKMKTFSGYLKHKEKKNISLQLKCKITYVFDY